MPISTTTDSDESKFDWLDFIISCTGQVSIYVWNRLGTEFAGTLITYTNQNFRLSSTYIRIEWQKYHSAIIFPYVQQIQALRKFEQYFENLSPLGWPLPHANRSNWLHSNDIMKDSLTKENTQHFDGSPAENFIIIIII